MNIGVHEILNGYTLDQVVAWYETYGDSDLMKWADMFWDSSGSIRDAYRSLVGYGTGIPQTYLMDRDGYVRYSWYGAAIYDNPTDFLNKVDELL